MTEQITKIKVNNDQTATINFKNTTDLDTKETIFTGKEKITDEFAAKFQGCIEGFIGCVPALEKEKKNITMNAIKFDYGKETEQLKNAQYSIKYAFNPANNAVINISTPNLPIYREEFDEKTFCISGKHEQDLYDVLELARKYLNGDTRTKQMKIEVA